MKGTNVFSKNGHEPVAQAELDRSNGIDTTSTGCSHRGTGCSPHCSIPSPTNEDNSGQDHPGYSSRPEESPTLAAKESFTTPSASELSKLEQVLGTCSNYVIFWIEDQRDHYSEQWSLESLVSSTDSPSDAIIGHSDVGKLNYLHESESNLSFHRTQHEKMRRICFSPGQDLEGDLGLSASNAHSESGSQVSAESMESNCSFKSHASWAGRRGRKRKHHETDTVKLAEDSTDKFRFRCTWCLQPFKKPSDWKRHEESQHAPQTEWICLAEGPEIRMDASLDLRQCVLCSSVYTHFDHALDCKRRVDRCMNASLTDRKFDRRDHLVQHLIKIRTFQSPRDLPRNFERWKQPMYTPDTAHLWDCGLCNERGMTWTSRYSHVLAHESRLSAGSTGKEFIDWYSWRQCVCTQGYSPRLQATLETLGLGRIFAESCELKYRCRDIDGTDRYKILSTLRRVLRSNGNCVYHTRNRTSFYYAQGWAVTYDIVPFWCGFCETMKRTKFRGSYECKFFAHIDRDHIMQGHPCTSWKPMGSADLRDLVIDIAGIASVDGYNLQFSITRKQFAYDLIKMVMRICHDEIICQSASDYPESKIRCLLHEAMPWIGWVYDSPAKEEEQSGPGRVSASFLNL